MDDCLNIIPPNTLSLPKTPPKRISHILYSLVNILMIIYFSHIQLMFLELLELKISRNRNSTLIISNCLIIRCFHQHQIKVKIYTTSYGTLLYHWMITECSFTHPFKWFLLDSNDPLSCYTPSISLLVEFHSLATLSIDPDYHTDSFSNSWFGCKHTSYGYTGYGNKEVPNTSIEIPDTATLNLKEIWIFS